MARGITRKAIPGQHHQLAGSVLGLMLQVCKARQEAALVAGLGPDPHPDPGPGLRLREVIRIHSPAGLAKIATAVTAGPAITGVLSHQTDASTKTEPWTQQTDLATMTEVMMKRGGRQTGAGFLLLHQECHLSLTWSMHIHYLDLPGKTKTGQELSLPCCHP